MFVILSCFFFQAEDGIRDGHVTGVQTCALPISRQSHGLTRRWPRVALRWTCGYARSTARPPDKIGRASCRERVQIPVDDVRLQKQRHESGREGRDNRTSQDESREGVTII